MLAAALKAEAASFVAQFAGERLPDGRQRVVRHGAGPERDIQTGIGAIRKRCSRLTGSQVDGLKLHGRSSSMRFCGCPAAIASSVAFR